MSRSFFESVSKYFVVRGTIPSIPGKCNDFGKIMRQLHCSCTSSPVSTDMIFLQSTKSLLRLESMKLVLLLFFQFFVSFIIFRICSFLSISHCLNSGKNVAGKSFIVWRFLFCFSFLFRAPFGIFCSYCRQYLYSVCFFSKCHIRLVYCESHVLFLAVMLEIQTKS